MQPPATWAPEILSAAFQSCCSAILQECQHNTLYFLSRHLSPLHPCKTLRAVTALANNKAKESSYTEILVPGLLFALLWLYKKAPCLRFLP